jgi:tRNA dimethylallyltransferase
VNGSANHRMNTGNRESHPVAPDWLVVITGPTAVGKTDISIDVARQLEGEIVSCDSMQVYKYMDIGTAKPSVLERKAVPHHLIDVVAPDEDFNVARFQELAEAAISDITSRGRTPVLVGGTGLYIKAVVDGFLFPWEGASPKIRESLEEEAAQKGHDVLYARLEEVDPEAAKKIHPNDTRRIVRALEVHITTGRPISELWREGRRKKRARFDRLVMLGLVRERSELYERIDARCDKMIELGLVEETKELLDQGYSRTLTSGQALGYKEVVRYLKGECSFEEAVELIKRDTRRYAKRQLTWFRADPRMEWLDVGVFESKKEAARCILSLIKGKMAAM